MVGLSVLLTLAAGATDLICVTRLGDAFASIMTGNIIFLGNAAVTGDGGAAVRLATAVGAFVVGTAVGTAVAGRRSDDDPDWPGRVTLAIVVELLLLGGFLTGWVLARAQPGTTLEPALLATAAAAMGVQTAAHRQAGTGITSTTYFTGTLSNLVSGAVAERRFGGVSVLLLVALAGGALGAAALLATAPVLAPALPTALVLVVALVGAVVHRRAGPAPRPTDATPSTDH